MSDTVFDVVIIGNGILGLSTAFRLLTESPGLRLALVGPPARPGCATLAAGAMINVWAELSEDQLEDPALAERFELTLQGGTLWDSFAKELGEASDQPLHLSRGTYLFVNARSTPVEFRTFRYIQRTLKARGIQHHPVSPEELPWLKPADNAPVFEVMWIPDGHIDSRAVISALDRAIARKGAQVFPHAATAMKLGSAGFLKQRGLHELTLADQTTIRCQQVLLANGAFAQSLVDQSPELRRGVPRLLFGGGAGMDLDFPSWVHKYGGLGKEIFDLKEVARTTDRGGACGVHLVPYGNGTFYAGASSGVWTEPDPLPKLHGTHVLTDALLREVSRAFFFAGIQLRGNGFRPISADCFPLLGESHVPGVWYLNGTKRDGFTMAPHLSGEITKGLLGKKTTLPERFRPSRKLLSFKTKSKAIEAAELMYRGSDFQHGGLQAPYMAEAYLGYRSGKIQAVYELRGIREFGIHPELLHLYENEDYFRLIDHARERA